MQVPDEVPVMTLPKAILFPDAMLPLHIFEPRYRKMLTDALQTHRMFCVGMQRTGTKREVPCPVAGLGLIRACVTAANGTSHLVLQGLARVELLETVRYRPYRVQRVRALPTTSTDSLAVDALASRVLDLVAERLNQAKGLSAQILAKIEAAAEHGHGPTLISFKQIAEHLVKLENPDRLADLVSCTLLPGAIERQTILETADLEIRLRLLVQFLRIEVQRHAKD